MPTEVIRYRSKDGKEFETEEQAYEHENLLLFVDKFESICCYNPIDVAEYIRDNFEEFYPFMKNMCEKYELSCRGLKK